MFRQVGTESRVSAWRRPRLEAPVKTPPFQSSHLPGGVLCSRLPILHFRCHSGQCAQDGLPVASAVREMLSRDRRRDPGRHPGRELPGALGPDVVVGASSPE